MKGARIMHRSEFQRCFWAERRTVLNKFWFLNMIFYYRAPFCRLSALRFGKLLPLDPIPYKADLNLWRRQHVWESGRNSLTSSSHEWKVPSDLSCLFFQWVLRSIFRRYLLSLGTGLYRVFSPSLNASERASKYRATIPEMSSLAFPTKARSAPRWFQSYTHSQAPQISSVNPTPLSRILNLSSHIRVFDNLKEIRSVIVFVIPQVSTEPLWRHRVKIQTSGYLF